MRKLYLLAFGLLVAFNCSFGQAVSTYGALGVDGKNLVDKNGNPVQLQGMSLFWSNWKEGYNFWNANVVAKLKNDWCINVIRAAMGVEEENGYNSQPSTNLARVETIIDAAIANDIYVIVDFHSHAAHNYKSKAITFFKHIANKYKNNDNIIYELYNEPLNVSWNNTIKPYCQDVANEIRKIDTDNVIICGTRQWSQRVDEVVGNTVSGSNIAYGFHFYAGSHYSTVRGYAQTAIDANLCVFVTEYGTVNANGDGSANTSNTNTWYDWIEANNLSHCNWSVSNKGEGASVLNSSVTDYTGTNWTDNDYTTSGKFVKDYLNDHCPNYGTSAPTITKQPEDTEVYSGYDATFTIFATGGSLTYQWQKNNQNINGATSNSYTVTGATASDIADYSVKVTNSEGTVTSDAASLTISSTTPYNNGTPFLISATSLTRIDIEEFDIGNNYNSNTSGASYNDLTTGNVIPVNEGNGPSDVRSSTDADIGTSYDEVDKQSVYIISRNQAGEWWNYSVEVEESGYYNIEVLCIAGESGNTLKVEFDGVDVTGNLSVPIDAGYYPLQKVTKTNIQLSEGIQIMRLIADGNTMNISDIKITRSSDEDCEGNLFGSAVIDDCDVCTGGTTGIAANTLCEQDCNNDWGGDAYLDDCDKCVGGKTGKTACVIETDCNNDLGGTAYLDDCNECVGGNTGKTECVISSIEIDKSTSIRISPNPFHTVFNIKIDKPITWEIVNIIGNTVKSGSNTSIDMSGYPVGMYFLHLSTGEIIKLQKN